MATIQNSINAMIGGVTAIASLGKDIKEEKAKAETEKVKEAEKLKNEEVSRKLEVADLTESIPDLEKEIFEDKQTLKKQKGKLQDIKTGKTKSKKNQQDIDIQMKMLRKSIKAKRASINANKMRVAIQKQRLMEIGGSK